MVKNNKKVAWVPEHIKEGRFGKWLAEARDWAVSRNRFWGTPLPIWQSADGKDFICVGSIAELEKLSGQTILDLHKHIVDKITFIKNGQTYARVPEVLDCWFESGAMPYAERHYPFENKKNFKQEFPAQFIAEGQDQTRGWFYTMMVIATAIFKKTPFLNVVVNGIVLAEDGQKMSKRLKNYPDPAAVINQYGADALRYYLMSSPVVKSENLNFNESGVKEVLGKVIMTVNNVLSFYELYANKKIISAAQKSNQILDIWITAKLHKLIKEVTGAMESYDLMAATRPLGEFITELSTWYLRRSRERFKGDDARDAADALSTLHTVLLTLSKLMAPVTPFIAEHIFQTLKKYSDEESESVHLTNWPTFNSKWINQDILEKMSIARRVVEAALSLRAVNNLKVRQPLSELLISGTNINNEFLPIIGEEINVARVNIKKTLPTAAPWKIKSENELAVALNTEITEELRQEGILRELVHAINSFRKENKLTVNDRVAISISTENTELKKIITTHKDKLAKEVLASSLDLKDSIQSATVKELMIDGKKVLLDFKRK